jgi:hypothetical protein
VLAEWRAGGSGLQRHVRDLRAAQQRRLRTIRRLQQTITAIGSGASLLGGAVDGHLVSIFSIPPTSDATVNAAGDLPGPGAVALPATATLCTDAMTCP